MDTIQTQKDPLKFLDIKRKRQQNKNNLSKIKSKQRVTSNQSQLLIPSFNSLNSIENTNCVFKKQYDPQKYFSVAIQAYLNKANKNIKKKCINLQKNQLPQQLQIATQCSKISIEEELPFVQTFQKLSEFDKKQQKYNIVSPVNRLNIPTQEQRGINQYRQNDYSQSIELKQCQICSRKFNPTSYIKHVRICEKVFFQKRAPFNSRSKSKENIKKQSN